MSGICGMVFRDRSLRIEKAHLSPMLQALDTVGEHGGQSATFGHAGFGSQRFSRRLAGVAEVDRQSRRLTLAFHGSLFESAGLFMSSACDADRLESILRLYAEEGTSFLHRLRGEFALAVWDDVEQTLHLAVDPFRVHPLFYYADDEKLVFASRLAGIRACPFPVRLTIDPTAIVDIVAGSVIATPKTVFREVKKLPPGHLLSYRAGDLALEQYWNISFLEPNRQSRRALGDTTRRLFREAVEVRLHADRSSGQIGTFLSGGVDSSTVVGVLTQLVGRPVKTFSIGFGEQRFNEIDYARIAARAFGADHHEYLVTPQDACDAIPVLLESFDEPYANGSAIPTYFCAKVSKEHGVDTLYAGDGGDELFAGNERYATQHFLDYYHTIPAWLREPFLRPLVFALADSVRHPLFVKGKKYILRASIPYPNRLTSYGVVSVIPLGDLLEEGFLDAVGREYDTSAWVAFHYLRAPARTELDRQLYIDLKLAISDNDLFKVTRMTEAAGVTVRFPFLDRRLAEFAATVPAKLKMRGRRLRSFFKETYADLLPAETRRKKKHGFGVPIPVWLRTHEPLNALMRDLVLSPRSLRRGYFKPHTLEAIVERHKLDETSFYGTLLWNLMMLELWLRRNEDAEGMRVGR